MYDCVLQQLRTRSCDPNSEMGNSDYACCGPDTLAIQRSTHEMIQRFLIHAVQTDDNLDPEPRYFMQVYTILSSVTFILILKVHLEGGEQM